MAKATHGVWEGHWYFEVRIHPHSGNSRIGWSQIRFSYHFNSSGDLQAPCGYDRFSYSFRDSPGSLFHKSERIPNPKQSDYSEGYGNHDLSLKVLEMF